MNAGELNPSVAVTGDDRTYDQVQTDRCDRVGVEGG
jgi:hypothetical protein